MRWLLRIAAVFLLSGVMAQGVSAKEFKYFSVDLLDGWHELKPQAINQYGTYVAILTNQAQDTAITVAATVNPAPLEAPQMLKQAQSIVQRMQTQGISFVNGNFDEKQGVFVAAGMEQKNQEEWRIVMTQDNQVLYTVIFNGAQIEEASQILNSLKSVAN